MIHFQGEVLGVSTYTTRKKGTLRNIVVIISYNTEKTTANKTLNIYYRKQITDIQKTKKIQIKTNWHT